MFAGFKNRIGAVEKGATSGPFNDLAEGAGETAPLFPLRDSKPAPHRKWFGLRHWLFGCAGHVEHEMDANGVWWIGLRCHHCGKLASKSRSLVND